MTSISCRSQFFKETKFKNRLPKPYGLEPCADIKICLQLLALLLHFPICTQLLQKTA